ncbi:MAG: 3-methyl-2-oxobutanoate dehydrogenase subunit VorB [Acetobacteraceae bacterium]|nr:3-methyl-2-oxobutanoate dehydrogenase subunit VorB [Acetobacteraceae bacterium]
MGDRVLMKGNEAIGEAAIVAGCRCFFGYPITPQNELPEYMARRLPEVGGVFVQAESEVAAINMVYGAAAAGARAMTSSSSPGVSLKQEGISYLSACELPCVVVNMVRGGPGLGGIQPAQSDYFQATRGGGHGDYRTLVYGAASVQELVDLTIEAFDAADRYRNPVLLLADGILGQMMEPAVFPDSPPLPPPAKPWAVTGASGRPRNLINSLILQPDMLEAHNWRLMEKFRQIEEREVRWEEDQLDDAELVVVAYGTTARVVRAALGAARREGLKVGLLRPITLWPFPAQPLRRLKRARAVLTVEMSTGQMVEDVRLAVEGRLPVQFYGRTGGVVPTPREVLARIKEIAGELAQEAGGRK